MTYRYYIETLGCSKNQVDSEVMMGLLDAANHVIVNDPFDADVIVVNTCGFIEDAKRESLDSIFELLHYKKHGNCRFFIVAGCLAQRYASELAKEIEEVDAFIGTTTFNEIVNIIQLLKDRQRVLLQVDSADRITPDTTIRRLPKGSTGFLKISEGCDNRCTYCIIPKLRGRYRSRNIENIVAEAKAMAQAGVSELIIIAQDTSRYGIDNYKAYKLVELLEQLNAIAGIKWIRLQYIYPDILTEETIKGIAALDKVVDYFDIPIQHASDSVLKRMHRNTTQQQIRNVIKAIRKYCETPCVRTTVIVGFPGETEQDYNLLLDFVKEVKFDRLGAFRYSLEENTPAYALDGRVEEAVATERLSNLMAIQQDISETLQVEKLNTIQEVLIEEIVEQNKIYVGRTAYDAPEIDGICYVHTDGKALEIGQYVSVLVTDCLEFDIIGEYVEHSKQINNF